MRKGGRSGTSAHKVSAKGKRRTKARLLHSFPPVQLPSDHQPRRFGLDGSVGAVSAATGGWLWLSNGAVSGLGQVPSAPDNRCVRNRDLGDGLRQPGPQRLALRPLLSRRPVPGGGFGFALALALRWTGRRWLAAGSAWAWRCLLRWRRLRPWPRSFCCPERPARLFTRPAAGLPWPGTMRGPTARGVRLGRVLRPDARPGCRQPHPSAPALPERPVRSDSLRQRRWGACSNIARIGRPVAAISERLGPSLSSPSANCRLAGRRRRRRACVGLGIAIFLGSRLSRCKIFNCFLGLVLVNLIHQRCVYRHNRG